YCIAQQTCPPSTNLTLDCENTIVSGDTHLDPNIDFTISIPYQNGDGAAYSSTIVTSNLPGFNVTLPEGIFQNEGGTLIIRIQNLPNQGTGGLATFTITINGKQCKIPVTFTAQPQNN